MINYHSSWKELFTSYNIKLTQIEHVKYYPSAEQVFRVIEMDIDKINLVFLGQDPYHGPNQANGLAFSVNKTEKIPPSLKNIFKELNDEFPERNYNFEHGDLTKWCNSGIFLLNSALTVKDGEPGSHMKLWEGFTNDAIEHIAKKNKNCIFLLLGNYAQTKQSIINDNNRIIKCVHPSPLSASRGFFNSGVFKKIEEKLKKEIDWQN